MENKNKLKIFFKIIIYIFAVWGFVLTAVFFAMKFGLTKSSSMIDAQSDYFKNLSLEDDDTNKQKVADENWQYIQSLPEWDTIKSGILKDKNLIDKVSKETGVNSRLIITPLVAEQLRLMTSEREIFKKYFAPLGVLGSQTQFSLGIYGIKEKTAKQIEANLKNLNSPYYLGKQYENILDYKDSNTSLLVYADTLEPVKDQNINPTTSSSTNIFSSSTPTNSSSTLNSTSSLSSMDRKTILLTGSDEERIKRLTNSKDHYYSYLYAALYMKQLMTAWKGVGYDISNRPEIISTLYNIGFENSRPNANSQVGGAQIDLNGKTFSFGSIGFYFYFSDELVGVFNR